MKTSVSLPLCGNCWLQIGIINRILNDTNRTLNNANRTFNETSRTLNNANRTFKDTNRTLNDTNIKWNIADRTWNEYEKKYFLFLFLTILWWRCLTSRRRRPFWSRPCPQTLTCCAANKKINNFKIKTLLRVNSPQTLLKQTIFNVNSKLYKWKWYFWKWLNIVKSKVWYKGGFRARKLGGGYKSF
jgi:hypothetical protein